jgi:hypothetical protein
VMLILPCGDSGIDIEVIYEAHASVLRGGGIRGGTLDLSPATGG